MNDLTRLAAKTRALADQIGSVGFEVVQETAAVVEASIDRAIGRDAPHRRVAGGSVGVTQRVLERAPHPAIMVKAKGALHLLANPVKPHRITSRPAGSRQSRRQRLAEYNGHVGAGAKPLRTPYGPKYAVNHPGSPGKDTWRRGVDEARPLVGPTMAKAVAGTIRKVFG